MIGLGECFFVLFFVFGREKFFSIWLVPEKNDSYSIIESTNKKKIFLVNKQKKNENYLAKQIDFRIFWQSYSFAYTWNVCKLAKMKMKIKKKILKMSKWHFFLSVNLIIIIIIIKQTESEEYVQAKTKCSVQHSVF